MARNSERRERVFRPFAVAWGVEPALLFLNQMYGGVGMRAVGWRVVADASSPTHGHSLYTDRKLMCRAYLWSTRRAAENFLHAAPAPIF